MYKSIVLSALLIGISCGTNSIINGKEITKTSAVIKIDEPEKEPYNLKLKIEDNGNEEYRLVAIIDFSNGAFVVSPLSNNDFKGLFQISIKENPALLMNAEIEEIPRSVEEIDQFGNFVNLISKKTTYKRKLTVKAEEDFKVSGFVRFTIEPQCTFEEIPFDVFYKDEKLSIQKYPKLDKRTCGLPE